MLKSYKNQYMKARTILLFSLVLLFFSSCKKEQIKDYTAYVNPFIGTGGHGHTFPGATTVNGMVQLSPDTRRYGWDACGGYHYTDTLINGFSHTHLSGTGIGDYGDILLMPIVGEVDIYASDKNKQNTSYASLFSHKTEKAVPGYYSVNLERYNVKAELTTSSRVGMHRYTFKKTRDAGLLIDLDYAIYPQKDEETHIEVISNTEIKGYKKTKGWAPNQKIYFYAVTNKPFNKYTIFNKKNKGKIFLQFHLKNKQKLLVKVGLSAVDCKGAKLNVEKEIPNWDFDEIRVNTRKNWNNFLSKIDAKTKVDSIKEIFYTALYHTAIAPNIFSDVDGRYRGLDGKIHTSNTPQYTVFSTWDTMRALHPLFTIISPNKNDEYIQSLLTKYKEGGVLPMWELAGNYTGTMIGYNAVPIIVDAYMKGSKGFDSDLAYKAIKHVSNWDTTGLITYSDAFTNALMPISKKYKNELGFIPSEKERESVAKGLEYAYQDWCILQMAKEKNDKANIKKYQKLAENYKNYFDEKTGFMRGKHLNKSWRKPFNPRSSTHRQDDYCEGTAWQWLWFVPHQPDSLVKLLGGKEKFIKKLDGLFTANSTIEGSQTSVDISGLIGQYAHGNEPSHHIIHLYNYVDESYKTQELIDSVLYTLYDNKPNGLSGNEDCGQMSAWYVLNSMGFYQVCPGKPIYSIGRPIFDKITVKLENGKKFKIKVLNNSKQNRYITKIKFNGVERTSPFFTHEELIKGGKLEITMSDKH